MGFCDVGCGVAGGSGAGGVGVGVLRAVEFDGCDDVDLR